MRNTDKSARPAEFYSAATQSQEQRGESPLGTHATGLCSAHAIKPCLIPKSRGLQVRCLLASNLAPNNIFVISTIVQLLRSPNQFVLTNGCVSLSSGSEV